MFKVVTVVGTRPNFNKEMLIHQYLVEAGIKEIIIHTGQHYDVEMSKVFFHDCDLPEPDYNLEVGSLSHAKQTGLMMEKIEEILLKEKPDIVLVYGDVNSTMATALAAAKLRVPIAHIEAGPRNKIKYMPEEINRVVTDRISTLLFAPTKEAYDNLVNENYPRENIFFTGDILKDNLHYIMKKHNIELTPSSKSTYLLATVHRCENTDVQENIQEIIEGFIQCKEKIIFPLHPRTKKQLERFGLFEKLRNAPNIELKPPLGYVEFVKYLAGAKKVLTDSGGVRREAYILHKPVITVINEDGEWWPEIVAAGWNKITGPNKDKIIDAIKHFDPTGLPQPEIFGDGTAARKIVAIIINFLKNHGRT